MKKEENIYDADVAVIVVTYNRKELLVKNIESIKKQSYKNYHLYIIDNASTDNTYDEIKKYINNSNIYYFNTNKNLGGAGGFNFGMKKTFEKKYKYIWMMDDDTMPKEDALEELINADKVLNGNYGFLSSVVLWKDGQYCAMNKQYVKATWNENVDLLKYGLLETYFATFVSFFTKSDVVRKVGLPIKEFFIWSDDIEYTNRISKKYTNYIVGKSEAVHYTTNNVGSDIVKDDNRIDRYKYAYRNGMYVAKTNGLKAVIKRILRAVLTICRVITKSKKHKLKKIGIIICSSIKGLFFNPPIEYIGKK